MRERLVWEQDGVDWPHREASRFVRSGGLCWHVQHFKTSGPPASGPAPLALLIHGTGAATHSWRGLAPLLAQRLEVLAFDLPGHGFTDMPAGGPNAPELSLEGMAQAIGALLRTLDARPALVVGHSAGAAIAVRMSLAGLIESRALFSLNGALLPFGGVAGQLFSPVARLMASTSMVPRLFSRRAADPAVLRRLMDGTGSNLDPTGLALYGRLVRNPGHAAGALGMMANWNLQSMPHELPLLKPELHLLVGGNDRTISPRQADRVLALLPVDRRMPLIRLAGLGHLAHEERPDLVADAVLARLFQS